MASLLHQLATIILVASAVQTLVTADDLQEYEDYEESDVSYLRKLITYLNMLTVRPKWDSLSDSSDGFEVDSPGFEDVNDDERQSRSSGSYNYDNQEHFCMTVTKQHILSDNHFEYRPSILEENVCQPVVGELNHNQKGICYVRGRSCQTMVREISFFKRQRHSGNCWKPELRNVSDGCRCYFERHNLRGKSFTG